MKISLEKTIQTAQAIEKEQGWEAALLWLLTVPGGHTEEEARRRIKGLRKSYEEGQR